MIRMFKPVFLSLILCMPLLASAQNWPAKPVRLLVGLAAGGGVDLVARIFSTKLADALGQPFIVENRLGGGSIVAIESTVKALPDGYTLLFSPNGAMVMNPTIYRKLSYAPLQDLTPISLAVTFPLVLSINANLPANSVSELVTWLKANRGKANCAGTSQTFQMAISLLTSRTGTECTFIQYKGNNETAQALMTGDVHFALVDTGPIFPAIKGGKIHPLAVTSTKRLALLPEVPTMAELGITDFESYNWQGIIAPAGTPAAIIAKLNAALNEILLDPEVIKQISDTGSQPGGGSPQDFAQFIRAETTKWAKVIKSAKIEPQ